MIDTPILNQLLQEGSVWKEKDGEYVGLASDGLAVNLGYVEENVESYLSDHPTPDTW